MLLKVDCLPNAVGKQPSIPLIYLGRKWTLNWWWWWWLKIASISWNLNSFFAFITTSLYCPISIIALVSILTLWTYGERYVSGDQMELTDFREGLGSVSVQGVQLQKLLVQLALVSFDQVRRLFPFRSELVDIFYFNMDGVPSRQENGNKLYKGQDGKSSLNKWGMEHLI